MEVELVLPIWGTCSAATGGIVCIPMSDGKIAAPGFSTRHLAIEFIERDIQASVSVIPMPLESLGEVKSFLGDARARAEYFILDPIFGQSEKLHPIDELLSYFDS